MKISIACPNALLQNKATIEAAIAGASQLTIEIGSLLSVDVPGDTLDERVAALSDFESFVGGLIADADDAEEIQALGQLKASIVEVTRHVQRESYIADARRSEVAEATQTDPVIQLHAIGHTSTSNASEQHGVAPTNEETGIEQEEEQQEGQPARRRR